MGKIKGFWDGAQGPTRGDPRVDPWGAHDLLDRICAKRLWRVTFPKDNCAKAKRSEPPTQRVERDPLDRGCANVH